MIDEHAETTLEGVFACGEIAGGTHGRNRMMGNSPARVHRLRAARGEGRGGAGALMSIVTTTDLDGAVEDAAAHLYVWALKDIPQDLRDALAEAAGRRRRRSPANASCRRSSAT